MHKRNMQVIDIYILMIVNSSVNLMSYMTAETRTLVYYLIYWKNVDLRISI